MSYGDCGVSKHNFQASKNSTHRPSQTHRQKTCVGGLLAISGRDITLIFYYLLCTIILLNKTSEKWKEASRIYITPEMMYILLHEWLVATFRGTPAEIPSFSCLFSKLTLFYFFFANQVVLAICICFKCQENSDFYGFCGD